MARKKVSPDYEAQLKLLQMEVDRLDSLFERHDRSLSKISVEREKRIVEFRKDIEESFNKKFEGRDQWTRWFLGAVFTAFIALLLYLLKIS